MNKAFAPKTLILTAFILTLIGFNSCTDNSVNSTNGTVDFSYVTSADTVDNSGILVLDTAKILLKDIKLNVSNTTDEKNFKTGTYVFYLNVNSNINTVGSAFIPVGTYDKLNFEIHKLGDTETPPDPDFVDGNGRYSVVVKGWYNGNYFIFKSDKSASQKLNFSNSLIVTETRSNITLKAQPYIWFINTANEYMDPNDPNNRSEIEHNFKDNVKANFKAFKDDDKNGVPD